MKTLEAILIATAHLDQARKLNSTNNPQVKIAYEVLAELRDVASRAGTILRCTEVDERGVVYVIRGWGKEYVSAINVLRKNFGDQKQRKEDINGK